MRSIKEFNNIDLADCALRPIAPKDPELEALLTVAREDFALAREDFALLPLCQIFQGERICVG